MKFICTQQNFLEGVSCAEKIISRNFALPILQNILIKCELQAGFAALASTDLEMGLEAYIPGKVEEGGAITVPAKIISGLVRAMPQENVVISAKNDVLSLECKNYKANIKGQPSGEFPLIPTSKSADNLFIKDRDFFAGIASVISSVSSLDVKPELTGVFVQFREDSLCFAATDSFRLSEKVIPLNKKNSYVGKVIIPKKSAEAMVRIFDAQEEGVSVLTQDNQIFIKTKESNSPFQKVRYVSRVIDAEFPNYEQIIPSSFRTTVQAPREEIIRHVKSASLFSQKINEVVLYANQKKQQLEILSKDQEYGDYHSVLPCEIEGEEVKVALNSNYLLDGAQGVSGPILSIKLNQEVSPILISSAEYDGFRHVLMPIKM